MMQRPDLLRGLAADCILEYDFLMLENIRFILVDTTHPGNIGGAARAMKNMGLSQLYLVNPADFPNKKATVRAAGADDLLANARCVASLEQALEGCELVFGTSARTRALPWPVCNPYECAQKVQSEPKKRMAFVFGRENSGLSNEELALCHYHVHIPTQASFSSLNLAAAVQVIAYELRMAEEASVPRRFKPVFELAGAEQMVGFYSHLEGVLIDLKFLDPKQPKLLMQRLKRLFNRAQVEKTELNILRGILSAIQKQQSRITDNAK